MKYLIKRQFVVKKAGEITLSYVDQFLGRDGQYYIATNNARTFPSVLSAQLYCQNNWDEVKSKCGVDHTPYIQGPRGGIYSCFPKDRNLWSY